MRENFKYEQIVKEKISLNLFFYILTIKCKILLSCVLPCYTENLTLLCLPLLLSLLFFNMEAFSFNPSITCFPLSLKKPLKNFETYGGLLLQNSSVAHL